MAISVLGSPLNDPPQYYNHHNNYHHGYYHQHTNNKAPVVCANCGGFGHVYKNCNHPVTSYGIICFRLVFDETRNCVYPEYLMVQRKDSLSYVEFIRGKYAVDNKNYLFSLFSNMTHQERQKIKNTDFDTLWKELWQIQECNAFQKDYINARIRFNFLKRGCKMELESPQAVNENGTITVFFDLNYIIDNTECKLEDCEWGFPKGRRNINEQDFTCAMREFREETGVNTRYVQIIKEQKPFEEVFSGSNKVRYKHIYYLAMSTDNAQTLPSWTKSVLKEIKDVQWFTYDEAQKRIREYNVERKELFKRVNQVIVKNLYQIIQQAIGYFVTA